MKLIILLLLFLGTNLPALAEEYVSGKDLCSEIQVKEKGRWLDVPQDYSSSTSELSSIYYWFLGSKYDSSKPTVIYVNGGPGATSHNYHKMYDDLSRDFNILFFDQRGYVCSRPATKEVQDDLKFYSIENSARDMEVLRKKLNIKKWSVLGHSYGATISLKYAELFPHSVRNITLVGPAFITPEKKLNNDEFTKKIKQRIEVLSSNIANCEAKSLINKLAFDFANSLGLRGLESLISKVKNDLLIENDLMDEDQSYEYLESLFENIDGKYSLNDPKFTWETQGDTELVVTSSLGCSFLGSKESAGCENSNLPKKRTFDVKSMKISTSVNIFLGEFDGVPSELLQLKNSFSNGKFYYLKNRGHGAFLDFYADSTSKRKDLGVQVLRSSLIGNSIEPDILSELEINRIY